MSYKLRITVTKEILESSKTCGYDPDGNRLNRDTGVVMHVVKNCALALAIRDIFPTASIFETVIFPFKGEGFKIDLPEGAQQFISDFDDKTPEERLAIPEFSFEISIPDTVIDRIDINSVLSVLNENPNLQLCKV